MLIMLVKLYKIREGIENESYYHNCDNKINKKTTYIMKNIHYKMTTNNENNNKNIKLEMFKLFSEIRNGISTIKKLSKMSNKSIELINNNYKFLYTFNPFFFWLYHKHKNNLLVIGTNKNLQINNFNDLIIVFEFKDILRVHTINLTNRVYRICLTNNEEILYINIPTFTSNKEVTYEKSKNFGKIIVGEIEIEKLDNNKVREMKLDEFCIYMKQLIIKKARLYSEDFKRRFGFDIRTAHLIFYPRKLSTVKIKQILTNNKELLEEIRQKLSNRKYRRTTF